MLEKVADLPPVKDMLEKSKPILGYDILDICMNGPEDKLEETRYCQPAMFIGGLAGLEKLRQEKTEAVDRAAVMAGLSLGGRPHASDGHLNGHLKHRRRCSRRLFFFGLFRR